MSYREIDRSDELEVAAAKYAPADALLAWSWSGDIDLIDYRERHVAFVSPEKETLTVCRVWSGGQGGVNVSVDKVIHRDNIEGVTAEIAARCGFRRQGVSIDGRTPPYEEDEELRSAVNGEPLILWDFQHEGASTYIARVTDAYGDVRLVGACVHGGGAVNDPKGQDIRVDIGLDVSMEEAFSAPTAVLTWGGR